MALGVARATKPAGAFRPGSRVIDENCDKLGAGLVRRLLAENTGPNAARFCRCAHNRFLLTADHVRIQLAARGR